MFDYKGELSWYAGTTENLSRGHEEKNMPLNNCNRRLQRAKTQLSYKFNFLRENGNATLDYEVTHITLSTSQAFPAVCITEYCNIAFILCVFCMEWQALESHFCETAIKQMYENNIHLYLSFNTRGCFGGYFSYSFKWRTISKTSSRQWQLKYWLTISKTVFTVAVLWSYLWYTVYNNFSSIKAHLIFLISLS